MVMLQKLGPGHRPDDLKQPDRYLIAAKAWLVVGNRAPAKGTILETNIKKTTEPLNYQTTKE